MVAYCVYIEAKEHWFHQKCQRCYFIRYFFIDLVLFHAYLATTQALLLLVSRLLLHWSDHMTLLSLYCK